jgi:hypothetical protein
MKSDGPSLSLASASQAGLRLTVATASRASDRGGRRVEEGGVLRDEKDLSGDVVQHHIAAGELARIHWFCMVPRLGPFR